MRNMTLGLRLGLSFGVLILLMCVFGGLAVWRINVAVASATDVATARAPEVMIADGVVTTAWESRFAIRHFLLTGDENSLRTGRKEIDKLKDHLQAADELVKRHPGMIALNRAKTVALDKTGDFETLVDKMEVERKNIATQRAALDAAAKDFRAECDKMRSAQAQGMNEDLDEWAALTTAKEPDDKAAPATGKGPSANADLAGLKERVRKIGAIEEIVDAGMTIRVNNFKAQALNDLDALRSVLTKDFDVLDKAIARLSPLLRQQENIVQIGKIKESADAYRAAMESILTGEQALQKGREDLFAAGLAVTDAAAGMGDKGQSIDKAATEVADGLSLTSAILLVGLVIALIAAVLIAWLSTRAITGPIREGVNALAATATEISATVSQLASNAGEAAAAVVETTTTVDEVRQTAQVAADKAKAVADNAQGASRAAETGRQATDQTIQGLNLIREQMGAIGESITRLSEQGQAVGDIVSTVADLAEQSNLLAVNASIEAAKAGDMGKGFAVVAQEIRTLAEQSKDSTKQVRAILTDVQKATGRAVVAADQGGKSVAEGAKQADEAGQAIRTLAATVQDATRAAVQIAASSQQQLVGMEQVGRAMENIKQATTQNAEGARQLAAAAHGLQEIGMRLKALVDIGADRTSGAGG